MLEELKNLINNSYSYGYKMAAITKYNNKIYKGVSIQNSSFRDMISSEQVLVNNLIINGVPLNEITDIYFLTDGSFNNYRYLRFNFLEEFFSDLTIHLYNIDGEERVIKLKGVLNV